MKYLSKFLPLKTLDEMYKALVRSHLDYCHTIYHLPVLLECVAIGLAGIWVLLVLLEFGCYWFYWSCWNLGATGFIGIVGI